MYSAKIVTDKGETFEFGYEYGTLFDIDPLNGINVDISTSQGFQQVGETIESQSVTGVSRTISGVIIGDAIQIGRKMLSVLTMFTTGKLYFNNSYFCNICISKTPYITKPISGRVKFSTMVYCNVPYWMDIRQSEYVLGGWEPTFKLPITYSNEEPHTFGIHDNNAFVNCFNSGDVRQPITLRFTAYSQATNFGIENAQTLEKILLNDSLLAGDIVTVENVGGRLTVTRERNGAKTNIFSVLDDSSRLFWVEPGDNVFKIIADTGVDQVRVSVSFYPGYVGVLDGN